MQCQATTNAGTQCSRKALSNSIYCWQHQNYKSNISESDKILDLEKERLKEFDINDAKLSLSTNVKFKVPEIDNIIQNYPIVDLLDYKVINYLLKLFQSELDYNFSEFKQPFNFLVNYFYGQQESNYKDFYKFLFIHSLAECIEYNLGIPMKSIFDKFKIADNLYDFRKINYSNKCIDPYIFIRSNVPIISPKINYSNFFTLMDICDPTYNVEFWIRTGRYTLGYDEDMLEYFDQKYKFTDESLTTPEQIYEKYTKLFFQYSVNPGFNTQILQNKQIPTLEQFQNLKAEIPVLTAEGVTQWNDDNRLWRQKNIGIHIFAEDVLSRYQNYSSNRINNDCRDSAYLSKDNSILLKSFNFCVPLETNIVVHRYVRNYGNVSDLLVYKSGNPETYIYTETALMSTSINYNNYRPEKRKTGIIFTLYVTPRTCCIPTYVESHENELIFPAGTKYILYDKTIPKPGLIYYTGVIIS
jgi:hypothetical protein